MTEATVAVIALLVLGWALVSGVWARHDVTGPFVFAVAGYLLGNPDWGPLTVNVETASNHIVAEVTLALVLFSDAARVNVAELRRDFAVPTRLLSIGLLLSVLLGGLLAGWLFSGFPWALAGFMGAALAPTDAALSVQVIEDERIPGRLRRALNVESGLNDGIATPIVVFMLAIAASQLGIVAGSVTYEAGTALRELGGGVLVGMVLGLGGGVLAELGGELLALIVWFVFGATLVPVAFHNLDGPVVLYALASLTIVRMLPVGLSLIGSGLDRPSVVFIGWFGPRGLASVVFALLAIEELGETSPYVVTAIATVALTVLLSVVLHGITAGPGGRQCVQHEVGRR